MPAAFQNRWDKGNKRLGKLRKAQKTPVEHCTDEEVKVRVKQNQPFSSKHIKQVINVFT